MIGGRFGRLVVQSQAENYGTQRQWLCLCDCGATTTVRTGHLIRGSVKSCGCGQFPGTHGMSDTREYRIWINAKARCSRPRHPEYKNYGGRGIHMCERWTTSFPAFLDDMGPCPSPAHELDREDNNGPYAPDNCKWATRTEQCNNRRNNVRLTLDGVTKTRAQWAQQHGMNVETLRYRLSRGEELLSALTRPPKLIRGKNC